jgi:AraC-like DNA-binding protein
MEFPEGFPLIFYWWDQPDKEISKLHGHNGLEVGYCSEGSGIFVVESKVYPFCAGDLVIINDREMHFARSTPGTTSRWAYVCFDPVQLIGSSVAAPELLSIAELGGPGFKNVIAGSEHPALETVVREVVRELDARAANYQSVVRGLLWSLLGMLHRLPGRSFERRVGSDHYRRIAPALELIAAQHERELDIEQLSRRCRLSATHFRRLFREAIGRTPHEYLSDVRLRMAAALLRNTESPVLDVALRVGYPTLSNFSRQFRAEFGCSPREFRRQHRPNAGSVAVCG